MTAPLAVFQAVGALALVLLAARALGARARFPMLFGLGLLGAGLFYLGLLHWGRLELIVILTPLAFAGAWSFWRSIAQRSCGPHTWPIARAWLWLLAPMFAIFFLDALAPAMGNVGNDVIAYHLLDPVLWMRAHRIVPALSNMATAYPALVETVTGAAFSLSGSRAANLLGLAFALLLLVQVAGLTRDLGGGKRAVGIAVALAACMPALMTLAATPMVDIAFATFVIAAARLAWAAQTQSEWLQAGALLGFACGVKYTGLFAAFSLLVALLVCRRAAQRPPAAAWAMLAGAAALTGGGWYVRNWIVYGTPVYPPPAFTPWLRARYLPPSAAKAFQALTAQRGLGFGHGLGAALLFPFHLTYHPAVFLGGGGIGIAPLALTPLGLAWVWHEPEGRYWALACGVFCAIMFVFSQEIRYWMFAFAIAAALAAIAAERLLATSDGAARRVARAAAVAAVALSIGYGGLGLLWEQGARAPRMHAVFSPAYAAALWQRQVPDANAFAFVNAQPADGPVLVLDPTAPVYYLRRPYIQFRGPSGEEPNGPVSVRQALAKAHQSGATEVLDTESAVFHTRFQITPQSGLRLLFSSPSARVYALPAPPAPPQP